ncbi:MAG TPA: winged helix-turn-helix transcriptional regulator [Thermotogota bacterium]|nr:winged helix-turn-helix transcriptional regulator [Thermotogota bacterium]HRW92610.1 winged helix-turn-helix transcriptional regulator [Thermotogota bacterium]
MDLLGYSFFNPSPDFRELSILRALTATPEISQERLAQLAGIVPSMVNRYIREFEEAGLVRKVGENRRRMRYELTQAGKYRLQFLTIAYLSEVARLYGESGGLFSAILDTLHAENCDRIFLYGAGIIGGILAEVLKPQPLQVLGFVDDASIKQGGMFHNLPVYAPDQLPRAPYDGMIVASFRHAERICDRAKQQGMKNLFVFQVAPSGRVALQPLP